MVKRRITLCSESLRIGKGSISRYEKYSYDGNAVVGLLKNNIDALKNDQVGIDAIGFGGKDELFKKIPQFVKDKIAEFHNRPDPIETFIIVLRDSDTNDSKKISALRRKISDKIRRVIGERDFARVRISFAVQAIEAWILADELKLNEYLGVTNKVKRHNDPETIKDPKQIVTNLFKECGRTYSPRELLRLLPQLRIENLSRCKHFNELYTCVQKITEASA
jgi:hypothetical protein